jgi:proteasome lid subunit RPN8/RPN11
LFSSATQVYSIKQTEAIKGTMRMHTISLKPSVKDDIIAYCTSKKPHEACGFLLGSMEKSIIYAGQFQPIPNISTNPENHFSMDPERMIPLVTNTSSSGASIIGIVHSHPNADAVPSEEDIRTHWYLIPTHWIISLKDKDNPVLHAYHYTRHLNDQITPDSNHRPHFSYLSIPIALSER